MSHPSTLILLKNTEFVTLVIVGGERSAFKHYCETDNIDNTVISYTLGGSKCFSHLIEDHRIPHPPKCS